MINYEWDISAWVNRMLVDFLRTAKQKAWLEVLLSPLADLHALFLLVNADIDLKTRYNSQQKRFAAVLNLKLDPAQNRIRVITGSDAKPLPYTYFKNEGKPKRYIYFNDEGATPPHIYFEHEHFDQALFIVFAPASLAADEIRLKAWINYFKLANTSYIIIYE